MRVVLDATAPLPFAHQVRPNSGGRALLRHRHARAKPGDQVANATRRHPPLLRQSNAPSFDQLALLKPGGRLVYATCSLEPEENEE